MPGCETSALVRENLYSLKIGALHSRLGALSQLQIRRGASGELAKLTFASSLNADIKVLGLFKPVPSAHNSQDDKAFEWQTAKYKNENEALGLHPPTSSSLFNVLQIPLRIRSISGIISRCLIQFPAN